MQCSVGLVIFATIAGSLHTLAKWEVSFYTTCSELESRGEGQGARSAFPSGPVQVFVMLHALHGLTCEHRRDCQGLFLARKNS